MDTGATFPALPEDKIEELDLPLIGEHLAETAEGVRSVKLAAQLIVKIEDGSSETYIIVRPRDTMGYRIDPVTGKLIKELPSML